MEQSIILLTCVNVTCTLDPAVNILAFNRIKSFPERIKGTEKATPIHTLFHR